MARCTFWLAQKFCRANRLYIFVDSSIALLRKQFFNEVRQSFPRGLSLRQMGRDRPVPRMATCFSGFCYSKAWTPA